MDFTNFNKAISGQNNSGQNTQSGSNIFSPLPGASQNTSNSVLPSQAGQNTKPVPTPSTPSTSSFFLSALKDVFQGKSSSANHLNQEAENTPIGKILNGKFGQAADSMRKTIENQFGPPQPKQSDETEQQYQQRLANHYIAAGLSVSGDMESVGKPPIIDEAPKSSSGSSIFSGASKSAETPETPNTLEMKNAQLKLQAAQDDHTEAIKNLNDAKTKTPELNQKVTDAQAKITQAQQELDNATKAREASTKPAVKGSSEVKGGIKTAENQSGMNFQQKATQLKNFDPDLKANLQNDLLEKINSLKEGKNFDLPDYLNQGNSTVSIKGENLNLSKMNPDMAAKIRAQLGSVGNETGASLDPEQMQDLIKRLNSSTFKEVGGELQVDQQRIDITNEVKDLAQKAFGNITNADGESVWNKAYQDYSQSKQSTDNLKNLLDIKSKTTPDEILSKVQKLQKTPEQKMILQNSIEEVKNLTGVDLNNPIQAIQQVMDKEIAVEDAKGNLSDAQKQLLDSTKEQLANAKSQSEAEQILKKAAHQEEIQSNNYEITKRNQIAQQTFKGRNPLLYKTIVRGAIGGTVLLPLFFARYVLFRKLYSIITPPKKPAR